MNPILRVPFSFWYAASGPHFAWPPLGLQCQSLHLIYLFYLSFLHILISKFNFQNSNFHIYSFNLYYFCYYYYYFIYLFIYLFIFKISSLNNFSKFWFPNLIPSFQNSNFHIYLFNHYIFVIIIILFIYLFIYFQNSFFKWFSKFQFLNLIFNF